uniref:Putative nidogen n=1 Tax=Panstrongylus lignarius TaxID=156445 RepID=A0A224X518_9HEMI
MVAALLFAVCCIVTCCYGHPLLLFTTTKDVRIANISKPSKVSTIVKDLEGAAAIDFYYEGRQVCWTDSRLGTIQCVSYNGTNVGPKRNVVPNGLLLPDGLACDWITGKLYWTDGETNRIEVVAMDGRFRKVLFWEDIDQPRAIALVPMEGLMFWTDWGEVPKIERAGMNGDPQTRRVIVTNKIFWPNGLTADYKLKRLYWLDGRLRFIDVMDYDGRNRRTITEKDIFYPFSLALFDDKLYWTDWETWSVHSVDRDTGSSKELIHTSNSVPVDIRVWDSSRQPYNQSDCRINNGNCSHLCLLSPYPPGYTCACPTGIKLIDNYTCRDAPEELILLVQINEICMISLDTPDHTSIPLYLRGIKHAIGIDYDPVHGFIYWSDDEAQVIRRARLNGQGQEDVVSSELQQPDGVAVDWRASNLYWTDTGTDRVQVLRINTTYTKVLINTDLVEPRAIAVSPDEGYMFWSDWNDKGPKIERAALDGSGRTVLVDNHVGWPNGIALDIPRKKVYWCDAKTDAIEVINYDGTDRREVVTHNLPHVFGLTLSGDYLYWTDWQRRSLDSAHKITGSGRKVLLDHLANMMGLKAVGQIPVFTVHNPCTVDNGGCAHLCLNTPAKHVCACQMGYELESNGKTCVVPKAFLIFARKEYIGRISIENPHNDAIIPASGIKDAGALDFDIKDDRIYWTDVKAKAITRSYINGSQVETIVEFGLESPEGLAVDWVWQNIYWTDLGTKKIEVSRNDGKYRRAIIWTGLQEPRSISVHPVNGFIYWSDWGGAGSLHRASLSGRDPKTIIQRIGKINSLTIDWLEERIYWCSVEGQIESANLDGSRRIIVAASPGPFSLSLYQDKIYWSDWETGTLYVANKHSGTNKTALQKGLEQVTSVVVYYSWARQRILDNARTGTTSIGLIGGASNGGSRRNGQCGLLGDRSSCRHLCLAGQCLCQPHYTLRVEGTCSSPNMFLFLATKNSISRLIPDVDSLPDVPLPVYGLKNVKSIDYDPIYQVLYWIDGRSQTIRKWPMALSENQMSGTQNSGSPVVVSSGTPFSLAVDPLYRLVYWSCPSEGTINATRIYDDNSPPVAESINQSPTIIVSTSRHAEKPRHIALHSAKGLLIWSGEGREWSIYVSRLDGGRRNTLISGQPQITALTVDTTRSAVFWATADGIHSKGIVNGSKRLIIPFNNMKVLSLAVLGRFIYRLHSQSIVGYELDSGDTMAVHRSHHHLMSLIGVTRKNGMTIVSNTDTVHWECATGEKVPTPVDCTRHTPCGEHQFSCAHDSHECIPLKWRCDSVSDCPDGSDESSCPICNLGAQSDRFLCVTGQCIDSSQVCDGRSDCPDMSDERDCCEANGGHQCGHNCILEASVCDGWSDCADDSDESVEACKRKEEHRLRVNGATTGGVIGGLPGDSQGHIILVTLVLASCFIVVCYSIYRCTHRKVKKERSSVGGVPCSEDHRIALEPLRPKYQPAPVRMSSVLGRSSTTSQPSTGSLVCYPLNPPPSPATTNKESLRPPPPTPCSTDVCQESDSNYQVMMTSSSLDLEPAPPPPTPSSDHYFHSD